MSDKIDGLGVVAQSVTAVVALWLASKANRTNAAAVRVAREAAIVDRLVALAIEVLNLAWRVRAAYLRLLEPFEDSQAKIASRSAWLTRREELSTLLDERARLFPEFKPALEAWTAVEAVEAEHVISDKAEAPGVLFAQTARNAYEAKHLAFAKRVQEIVTTIRVENAGTGK